MRSHLRSLVLTLVLVGLVAAGIGADRAFTIAALAASALSFVFFALLIEGGAHFGLTIANFLALYVCAFVFLREANFRTAQDQVAVVSLVLPVAGFMVACLVRRRAIAARLRARLLRELEHAPRLTKFIPSMLAIGLLSFIWPELHPSAALSSALLFGSMALITVIVVVHVDDVVMLAMDVALIFGGVAARMDRLLMPLTAFLTVYALIVVVFACLYRIAEGTTKVAQFALHGAATQLDFADSVWFSLVTLATVGYGDLAPAAPLARVLAGSEVVAGVVLLLFGFSEIMRHAGPDSIRRAAPPTVGRLRADIEQSRNFRDDRQNDDTT